MKTPTESVANPDTGKIWISLGKFQKSPLSDDLKTVVRPNSDLMFETGEIDLVKNTYKTIINKRIILYYYYRPLEKAIVLITFWNTQQNPKNLKL